jgi:hypothetical protein
VRYEPVVAPRIEQRPQAARFASEVAAPPVQARPVAPPPVIASREVSEAAEQDSELAELRAQRFRERFPGFPQEASRVKQAAGPTASERIQAYTDTSRGYDDEADEGFEEEAAAGVPTMSERAAAMERALAEVGGERPLTGHSGPGAYHPTAASGPKPELVPVPASVFDDDFFRKPNEELRSSAPASAGEPAWPEARVPSFAGYAADPVPETDELDIPAFLRRNH